jgi:hypothetical protein
VHVVVKVIVSLLPELDLLQVHLDPDIADIHVLKRDFLVQRKRAFVGDVSKGIEELFGPVFKKVWVLYKVSFFLDHHPFE